MTEPTAVVGDVHGEPERLRAALDQVADGRRVILVGDYVDRGSDSRGVLELLVATRRELAERLVLLRGNHEVTLLEFLEGAPPDALVRHGGLRTVRSYVHQPEVRVFEQFRRDFPPQHRELLESTVLCVDEPGLLVSHAGWDPSDPDGRSLRQMTLGAGGRVFDGAARPPKDLVVFGHFTQSSGRPLVTPHLVCLDTGCGTSPQAPLTVLLLPEREIHQF